MSVVTAPPGRSAAMPRIVRDAFGTLDLAGARWVLLRGGAELATAREIDVLVHPDDLAGTERALAEAGWLRVPAPGRGSHRFHVRYDPDEDRFLVLDLVSEIAFGRYAEHRTRAADVVLHRRQRRAGVAVLHPADAYWALLLHARHDVGAVEDRHVQELQRLEHAGLDVSPLEDVARRLADLRPPPSERIATMGRWTWRRLARRLGRRRARAVKGLTVAVLGADGAGKSTLVGARAPTWPFPVVDHYLGLYDTGVAAGSPPSGLRFLGRVRRFRRALGQARRDRRAGKLVLLDRYPYDVLVLDGRGSPRKRALQRVVVRVLCPAPDVALVLDAPGGVLHRRSREHDPETLERQRERYLELAARLPRRHRPHIEIVDATREPEAIRRDVSQRLWSVLVARGSGR